MTDGILRARIFYAPCDVTMSAQTYTQRALEHQRQELILGHMGLVRHILGRLKARLPSSVDLENLEAAGVLGLVEAANRFEPGRGFRFDTLPFRPLRLAPQSRRHPRRAAPQLSVAAEPAREDRRRPQGLPDAAAAGDGR